MGKIMNQNIYTTYCIGIDNEISINSNNTKRFYNTIKYFKFWLYYIVLILLNTHNNTKAKEFTVVHNRSERRIILRDKNAAEPIYYGNVYTNIREIFSLYTIVSEFSLWSRLKIFKQAIIEYYDIREHNVILIFWIDVYFWARWVEKVNPMAIRSYGHYDRLATNLSSLSSIYNYKFIMQQHGIIGETPIKHKLKIDRLYVFNDIELLKFKKHVVSNQNCLYEINYFSVVDFISFDFNNDFVVGIAEQPYEIMADLIEKLVVAFPSFCFAVMLHPNSNDIRYSRFTKYKNIKFFKKEKIININILITINSTLFLDYIHNGFNKIVILIGPYPYLNKYSLIYNNVKCVNSIDASMDLMKKSYHEQVSNNIKN